MEREGGGSETARAEAVAHVETRGPGGFQKRRDDGSGARIEETCVEAH